MAAKKKEVKPLPVPVAVLLVVLAFAVMGGFVAYLLLPNRTGDDNVSVEHSFAEESSDAPAPVVGEEKDYFHNANVGDTVRFGRYDQDGDPSNVESIEWQVLKKEDGRALVISRYALDTMAYNTERTDVAWSDSALRKWLADSFYSEAFTDEEREFIAETQTGENATDKMFVLSADEADEYFEHASWRASLPTDTAKSKGARVEENNTCWWWLRNDESSDYAPYVNFDGNIVSEFAVDYAKVAVRPAMWVIIDNDDSSDASSESDLPEALK